MSQIPLTQRARIAFTPFAHNLKAANNNVMGYLTSGFTNVTSIVRGLKPSDLTRRAQLIATIEGAQKQIALIDTRVAPEQRSFNLITPDAHGQILRSLHGNEAVHPQPSVADMIKQRLGEEGDNKRCFANIVTVGKEQDALAGIFTARLNVCVKGGTLSHDSLPGNIAEIKELEVAPFTANTDPNHPTVVVAVLYTISSNGGYKFVDSNGRALAASVYKYLHEEAKEQGYPLIITTLSPIRDLLKKPEMQAKLEKVDFETDDTGHKDALRLDTLRYLLSEKDPVMNFHLGNGAYIGDIKFNIDDEKDPIMVNYVYPSDASQLAANKDLYRNTEQRPMASHLFALVKSEDVVLSTKASCFIDDADRVPFAPGAYQAEFDAAPAALPHDEPRLATG